MKGNQRGEGEWVVSLAIALLILSVMLPAPVAAILVVQSIQQSSQLETGQPQSIVVQLSTNATITGAYLEFAGQNHSMSAGAGSYSYGWTPSGLGPFQYRIYLANSEGESVMQQGQFMIVDTVAPQITTMSPSGVQSVAQATLKVTTSEFSNCRWGPLAAEYGSLPNVFAATGFTTHQQDVVLQEGLNQYFIACADQSQNANVGQLLTVELNTPPKGQVVVVHDDGNQWLGPRTYEVKLTTTEPVLSAPSLSLFCGAKTLGVPLEGEGTGWKGYLKINEGELDCAGEFSLAAYDLKGLKGTEITGGKLAIVNTVQPRVPTGVKAAAQDGKVRVSWSQDAAQSDMVREYRIYRSLTGNTDKSNFKYTSEQQHYLDSDVRDGTGYFYAVTSVSKSGVESELSAEAFVKVDLANSTQFIQDSRIAESVDKKVAELESLASSIDSSIEEYSSDVEASAILGANGALEAMQDAKDKVDSLIGEVKTYRSMPISQAELASRFSVVDAQVSTHRAALVSSFSVVDRSEHEQGFDEASFRAAALEYALAAGLTPGQAEVYVGEASKVQAGSRIAKQVLRYEVTYGSGLTDKGALVVEKVLATPGAYSDLTVQEHLPRGVVKFSSIVFPVTPNDINGQGPFWRLSGLPGRQLSYVYEGEPEEQVVSAGAFLLPVPEEVLLQANPAPQQNEVTGNVVVEQDSGVQPIIYLLMGVGLLVVATLAAYLHFITRRTTGPQVAVREQGSVLELVAQSRAALASGNLEGAKDLYSRAKEAYSQAGLGVAARIRANVELNALYDELVAASL